MICFHILTFNINLIRFLYNSGSRVLKFPSNHLWSRLNQSFDISDCPWKLYLLVFSFYFLLSKSFWRIMTTGASISSKFPLYFSSLSLGTTNFLGDGPVILDDMITLIDLIKKTYWLQIQAKNLVVQKKLKSLFPVTS